MKVPGSNPGLWESSMDSGGNQLRMIPALTLVEKMNWSFYCEQHYRLRARIGCIGENSECSTLLMMILVYLSCFGTFLQNGKWVEEKIKKIELCIFESIKQYIR